LKAVFSLPLKTHRVTITGGEPLLQRRGVEILVELLNALKIPVSIETNGTYPIPKSWDVASWVIDCKLLGSGTPPAVATKHCEDWVRLTKNDFIKFVVTDRKDFEMAHSLINDLTRDGCVANLALSAASASPEKHIQLLKWMQDANLTNTILNVQIHKLLFPNSGGGKDTEV
jgi:organic radical activating enzyme